MALEQLLMIPGPTNVPPRVLKAMSKQMINHRGPEFKALLQSILEKLKTVFQTQNEILIFPCSGTGALEASIANTLSPGDKVLIGSIGYFGERFTEIARRFGADLDIIKSELGYPLEINQIKEKLESTQYKAVLLTHNETSTAVYNDIKEIGSLLKGSETLYIVDAISSLCALDIQTDNWGIDILCAASQKALMCPPGLGILSVSEKAWNACSNSRNPRYYWDFLIEKKYRGKGQTHYTPAIPQLYALEESLKMIEGEGLQNIFKRHEKFGEDVRSSVKSFGLELFAKKNYSDTITAVSSPVDVKALREKMREKNIVIAGGQGPLDGKIFRMGHMGYITDKEVKTALSALELSLKELGYK